MSQGRLPTGLLSPFLLPLCPPPGVSHVAHLAPARSELPKAHRCPHHTQIPILSGRLSATLGTQQGLPTQAWCPWLAAPNHISRCFLLFATCALTTVSQSRSSYLEWTHPTAPAPSEPRRAHANSSHSEPRSRGPTAPSVLFAF